MSAVALQPVTRDDPYAAQVLADLEALHLISSDGIPMESSWHVRCMNLLVRQISHHLRDRDDFFVGGNMFVYFSPEQARNRDFRGPDFFYVADTTRLPLRKYWVVWDENLKTPDVVIELLSESTQDEDRGPKFRIYRDTLQVGNYFLYDPTTRVLEGWRLDGKKYVPIRPDQDGRLFSDELNLTLGKWEGEYERYPDVWLRFFDRSGVVVPTADEAEQQRAETAEQKADALAAEVAQLRARLAQAAPEAQP